jgi:hypothetical protein
MKSLLAISLAAAAAFTSSGAFAQRPTSLAGTTWTLQANRTVLQLVINTQGGAGAPGAAVCQRITGTLNTTPDIEARGWYCPDSGRIHFIHRQLRSGDAMRVFTGNVSDDVIGQPTHMAGTMTVLDPVFGDLGEYNFSAVR